MANHEERQNKRQKGVSTGAGLGVGFIWICCFVFLYLIARLLFAPISIDVTVTCSNAYLHLIGFGFIALTGMIFAVLGTVAILQADKYRDE